MSLPLSDLVEVNIAVSPTLAPLAGFGELLFLTNDAQDIKVISTSERLRKFGSLKEVQDAFPQGSECIPAATAFYAQTPQPKHFTVGVMAIADSAGSLVGGEHASQAELRAISANKVKITIDGEEIEANFTFTSANDLPSIAALMQTAIRGGTGGTGTGKTNCTVTYTGGRFVITSGTTGANSFVEFMKDSDNTARTDVPFADFDLPLEVDLAVRSVETNASKMLGLTQGTALRTEHGVTVETVDAALGHCMDISSTFVAVALHKNLRDTANVSDVNGAAPWCEANKKMFMNCTNDYRILSLGTQNNSIAWQLKNKALRYTSTTYGADEDQYPECSLFGRIATVNYEGSNTVINLKFKKLPTISALNLSQSQKVAMDNLNVGGFMNFGGNLMYAEGRMADNGWIDAVHGLMWLEDRIQKGVFNLMYGTTTQIPYTDTGVGMVEQKVAGALEQGVRNGLLGAGYTPEGEFLPHGWKITAIGATEVAAEDKSNRLYRGLTFQCIGAGALNNVIISGSFSE